MNYELRGLWNSEGWNQSFTISGPSRNNYVLSLIENRINSMEKIKLFKNFINKTTVEFAIGTFCSEIPLSYNLKNSSEGSDIILKFRTVCQNYHMVILFLIIVYLYNKKVYKQAYLICVLFHC